MKVLVSAQRLLIPLTFIAFVLLRLFVPSPYYFIGMDEAKYLVLARTFPHHTLFNNQLYLVHPPLFPALIRLFMLFLTDHTAGIAVSFLFAAITFVAMAALFRLIGRDRFWIATALFVLAVSPLHIPTSRVIYKDSMFFGLYVLSLYFFLKGTINRESLYLLAAGLFGAACCLTSDLGLSLVPVFMVGHLIFRRPGDPVKGFISMLCVILIAYGSWVTVRLVIYKTSFFYPAGVDGTIELVRAFTPRHLFTPRYFPATRTMFNFGVDFSEFRINANIYELYPLLKLPIFIPVAFYIFVGITALYTILRGLIKKQLKNNAPFFFSLFLIVFSLPVVLHPEPRFLIPILVPMSYLFAHGLTVVLSFLPRPGRARKAIAWFLCLVLAAGVLKNFTTAGHFIFSLEKEVEGERTGRFLKALPEDGVMAQVGYPPELVYLTGKRVLALPIFPADLDYFIRLYGIHYLVYGQHYLAPLSTDDPTLIWCYHTIKYIQSNPGKYPLIKAVREDYRGGPGPDLIFIHGVRR